MSVIGKVGNYFIRGCKVYGPTVFGTGSEAMQKAYTDVFKARNTKLLSKQFFGDFWAGTKAAGKAAEAEAAKAAAKGGFWKNFGKNVVSIPKKMGQGWRVGRYLAKKQGKNALLGGIKGLGKGISKRIPVLGSLLLVAFELPNIVKATKEQGLMAGIKETGKAAARLGGFTAGTAAGAAVGSLICPGIGTFIGGLIGGILGDVAVGKIVGKSYSEKQAEAQEIAQAQVEAQEQEQAQAQQQMQELLAAQGGQQQTTGYTSNPFGQMTLTPQQIQQYQQALYGNMNDDFMYNATGLNYMS